MKIVIPVFEWFWLGAIVTLILVGSPNALFHFVVWLWYRCDLVGVNR